MLTSVDTRQNARRDCAWGRLIIVVRDAGVAAKFGAHIGRMQDSAQLMIEFTPAIKALDPK